MPKLPTILFPRGGAMNDSAPASQSSFAKDHQDDLTKTPTKKLLGSQQYADLSDLDGSPTPKKMRTNRSPRDPGHPQKLPSTLAFPTSLNEAVNAAFGEEHYEAGVEMIEQSRAGGILPMPDHLRILYAFSLRPTPDPITHRQSTLAASGSLFVPPSLPLVTRARILLADLAHLHGAELILDAISPSKIAQGGGIDAPSKASLQSMTKGVHRPRLGQILGHSGDSPDSGEEDMDGSFFDNESAVAQLQKNAFLVPFPLMEASSSSKRSSLTPAVKDTWDLLRSPPPGSLLEADLYRRAAAAADADDTNGGTYSLAAAEIRSIVMRHPVRRRGGRGRGGSSAGRTASSRVVPDDFTQEELLRHSPEALERYYATVYGKENAKDEMRTRAINGEALYLLASLWRDERRALMHSKQTTAAPPSLDEVHAVKALYGVALASEFPINKQVVQTALAAVQKAVDAAVAIGASQTAPPAPPKEVKAHPWFQPKFATSAKSTGFQRGSSISGRSSPPPSSQSSAGGPPSSPAGPSAPGMPQSPPNVRIARVGPPGCAEVGKALDTLFEVMSGNVLLYDRDGLFRSAFALSDNGSTPSAVGQGTVNAATALGHGGPSATMKWREMVGAVGDILFEILQLNRQADSRSPPVLDADALQRGIAQRLAWGDVGVDAIAIVDQALLSNLDEEQALAAKGRDVLSNSLVWETEPIFCWTRALIDYLKASGSVLRQTAPRGEHRFSVEQSPSQRPGRLSSESLSSQDQSVSLPPTAPGWEDSLSKLLASLPRSFAWLEINRKRWMDKQRELKEDGLERFADIDAKRERRVWADLEEVEAGQEEPQLERITDLDKDITEMMVVRGRQSKPVKAAKPARRDRSPSVLFSFEQGPAFHGRTRSSVTPSDAREQSPGFEIVQVTPSKKFNDVPISSSQAASQTAGPSSQPATGPKATRSVTASEAIQIQARNWVLDWGLDPSNTLNSARRPTNVIRAKAGPDAALGDHKTRLNALLRVAEVVLGEIRRRRRAALVKFAVLMWARRCIPVSVLAGEKHGLGRDMEWEADALEAPSSSAAVSVALGGGSRPHSRSTSSSQQQTGDAVLSSSARVLLERLEGFCTDARISAEASLHQAQAWHKAVQEVWSEAIELGVVPTSHGTGGASPPEPSSTKVKSELGQAVNWAFALEMQRLLRAVDIEFQGLSGTVLGWKILALTSIQN